MSILVFDLETDSANPQEARIVTAYLGILALDGRVVMEQEFLVRPDGFVIPDEAIAIHGITNEFAQANGLPLVGVLQQITAIIGSESGRGGVPLVGQNISYDLTVLDRELRRTGHPIPNAHLQGVNVVDTLVLDKVLNKFRKGTGARKLINLAASYGVELSEEEAHGARADAIAAGRIALKQRQDSRIRTLPLAELHRRQIHWAAEQAASLQHYFRTKAKPPQPDAVVDGQWPLRVAS